MKIMINSSAGCRVADEGLLKAARSKLLQRTNIAVQSSKEIQAYYQNKKYEMLRLINDEHEQDIA